MLAVTVYVIVVYFSIFVVYAVVMGPAVIHLTLSYGISLLIRHFITFSMLQLMVQPLNQMTGWGHLEIQMETD